MKHFAIGLAVLSSLAFAGAAHATLFNIVSVHGCSSGFCASLFHAATGSNAMSGANLGNITGVATSTGASNTYDDATGAFDAGFALGTNAVGGNTTVRLTGSLDFPAAPAGGVLTSVSSLTALFDGVTPLYAHADAGNTDATLVFDVGYQCCGSTGFDPNSFLDSAAPFPDGPGGMLMTLWGANGWSGSGWPLTSLGMDLRIYLVPVPEPGAIALIAVAFASLAVLRRRRPAVNRIR